MCDVNQKNRTLSSRAADAAYDAVFAHPSQIQKQTFYIKEIYITCVSVKLDA